MRNYLRWILVVVLALLAGSAYVQYLTTHPLQIGLYLSIAWLAVFALAVIVWRYFKGVQIVAALAIALVAYATGWYAMTVSILAREDCRPIPQLTRQRGDPGAGHTAVIFLMHGEPAVYDPICWINQMNEFDEQGIPFVPLMARPFFFKQLRDSYLRVGKSEHKQEAMAMLASMEQAYRREGDTETRFYMGFLDDNPRVPAAVINALNDGASRIIVSEVFVTVSSHTEEGEHQVREVDPAAYGAELKFTKPVWDSEKMHRMFAARVDMARGDLDRDKVGVLLVAHGQPDEWDEFWPLQTEHEMAYADRIIDALVATGYSRDNIGKAWMSFKYPKPAEEAERIHANGVEKLFFLSYTISAAGMHSQYDIPKLVYEADVPEDFPIVNLGAWGNEPLIIDALKERIDLAMRDETRFATDAD